MLQNADVRATTSKPSGAWKTLEKIRQEVV